MAGLPYIKIYFFENTFSTESKMFLNVNKILGRYAKIWIFHENNILHNYFSKLVHGYLTMRCVNRVKGMKNKGGSGRWQMTEIDLGLW